MERRILVVDDDEFTRQHLTILLEGEGYAVEAAASGHEALERARSQLFHLMITDLKLPDLDGLELLRTVRREQLPFGVIVVSGRAEADDALDAMKAGADDFVTKPFAPKRLMLLVARTLERRRLIDELELLRHQMREGYSFHNLVSKSPRMRRVFDLIEQVGPVGSTVLVLGETGSGKELVAQAIHAASHRRNAPWHALNCAALSDSLLESELFGHERGAFTGADRLRKGWFESANRGTLFLDEIGDVSPALQAKLLRVLQTGEFQRVGGNETLRADVRIVAATNRRLEDLVKAGRFRADLFYRLNVLRIELPPLRERKEDIPLLAMHFLSTLAKRSTPPVTEFEPDAMQALLDYNWPGNVRELQNAVRAAVALAEGTTIRRENLPATVAPRTAHADTSALIDINHPLPDLTNALVEQVERDYFTQLLAKYQGNVARCAEHSGLSRRSVTQKLQKYEIDRKRFRLGVAETDN